MDVNELIGELEDCVTMNKNVSEYEVKITVIDKKGNKTETEIDYIQMDHHEKKLILKLKE